MYQLINKRQLKKTSKSLYIKTTSPLSQHPLLFRFLSSLFSPLTSLSFSHTLNLICRRNQTKPDPPEFSPQRRLTHRQIWLSLFLVLAATPPPPSSVTTTTITSLSLATTANLAAVTGLKVVHSVTSPSVVELVEAPQNVTVLSPPLPPPLPPLLPSSPPRHKNQPRLKRVKLRLLI